MPTRRRALPKASQPLRQSPRKRKIDDANDALELKSSGLKESLGTETVSSKTATGDRNTESRKARAIQKHDLVVDEPIRTDVAEGILQSAFKNSRKSSHTNVHSATSKVKGALFPESPVDSEIRSSAKKGTKRQKTSDAEENESKLDGEKSGRRGKGKSKNEKEAEMTPLASRTPGLKMYVGAHVSIAKGVENAVSNSLRIGANAFALFLQSQRKWENPPLKQENQDAFVKACSNHHYDSRSHVVPHGSYLVNLAAKDETKAQQSYNFFLGDLKRCEALGIRYYNFHPGATNQEPLSEAISRLASRLNDALSETSTVIPLLENMAGTESIIGSRFTDLREIISQIKPEYKSRIGICLDTCHTFAAGYDLRTPDAFQHTFRELDEVVGLQYLKALHMNDSKGTFNSHKDLHQNIGVGFLGLRAFHNVMNEPRLQNLPMILETPSDKPDPSDLSGKKTIEDKGVWAREIKLLESLIGMDPEGSEFEALETKLSEEGRVEREKMEKWMFEQAKKKKEKEERARKKLATQVEKGQKNIKELFGEKPLNGRKASVSSRDPISDEDE